MSGNPITIRNLGPEDAFVLDRVRPGTFDNPPDPDKVWAFLATRVNELVVALDQGEVIGFAFGTVMQRISDLARERGCETLWLGTEGDNVDANGLYRALDGRELKGVSVYEWDLD